MAYGGHPTIPGLTAITPVLTLSRASGQAPLVVQVHSSDTTATFSDGGAAFLVAVGRAFDPFLDLEFTWDFGDTAGTETLTHPVCGTTVNANVDQTGPEAAYVYRVAGACTITLTVRGWNGSAYVTASTTTTATCAAWTGADRYFDSAYAGENGASDGTISKPYAAFADLKSWAEDGSNRRAFLKRGSSFSTGGSNLGVGYASTIRVEAYGSGAAPILATTTGSGAVVGTGHYGGGDSTDVVFSGIELRAGVSATAALWVYQGGDGDIGQPYAAMRDYAFLDCAFAGPAGVQLRGVGKVAGVGWTFWRCDFRRDVTTATLDQGLLIGLNDGLAIVGGSFADETAGNIVFNHHIYPNIVDHTSFRWIDFTNCVSLNFCLNLNARSDGVNTPHVLIDGCDITRTANGIDASNANNNPAQGRFDRFLVQSSAFHVGQVGDQGIGLYSTCLARAVVRDSSFWANPSSDIVLGDAATHLAVYRNRFDGIEGSEIGGNAAETADLWLSANTYGVTGYPDPPDPEPTVRRRFRCRRHV
jgi:hypothetical protein